MTEHHLTREKHTAYGTGGHDHHRASIERDGLRQSFWSCRLSTRLNRSCLDEPDPLEVLLRKIAERPEPIAREQRPERWRCGHGEDRRRLDADGKTRCRECHRMGEARRRKAA